MKNFFLLKINRINWKTKPSFIWHNKLMMMMTMMKCEHYSKWCNMFLFCSFYLPFRFLFSLFLLFSSQIWNRLSFSNDSHCLCYFYTKVLNVKKKNTCGLLHQPHQCDMMSIFVLNFGCCCCFFHCRRCCYFRVKWIIFQIFGMNEIIQEQCKSTPCWPWQTIECNILSFHWIALSLSLSLSLIQSKRKNHSQHNYLLYVPYC